MFEVFIAYVRIFKIWFVWGFVKKKLLLVDGHELLFRMFYGLPFRILDRDGSSVHAVVGFVSSILKVANFLKPDYLLVVFDSEEGSFRDEAGVGYKENRVRNFSGVDDEDNPFFQFDNIVKCLDCLGVRNCEACGVEADDVIAGYVNEYLDLDVFILSRDSDLFQLVSDRVSVVCSRGSKIDKIGVDEVCEKFGVEPRRVADVKALVGDKTDNVDGVFGVGVKTASKLLNEFDGVEDLLENLDRVFPLGLREKIGGSRDLIERNISLVRLDRGVDLPFELEELKVGNFGGLKTMDVLREVGVL